MSIPKMNENSSYTKTKLPSGKFIGLQPWRVKAEKELLFALEGLDEADETYFKNAREQMFSFLKKSVEDAKMFDALSNTDILKVAMELRKLSKGEIIEYEYTCPHCKLKSKDNVSVIKHAKIKDFDGSPIQISETCIINIKEVPATTTLTIIDKTKDSYNKFNHAFLLASIDSIVMNGEIYAGFTEDELSEWVDDMKPNDYEKLSDAIDEKTASVSLDRKYKCLKCKEEVQVKFGDLYDFLIF